MAEQTEATAGAAAAQLGAETPAKDARGQRKLVQGVVSSTRMHKTITVETSAMVLHPKYKKYVKRYTKFKAHDEEQKAKEGDVVEIMQTRPLSKTKRYRLVRIVRSREA